MDDTGNVASITNEVNQAERDKTGHGHPVLKAVIVIVALVIALLAAYGITMLVLSASAQSDGEQVQAELQRLNEAVDNVNIDAVAISAGNISQHLGSLKNNLDGWPWDIAMALPWFKNDITGARQLVDVSDSLTNKVLVPVANVMKDYSNEIDTSGILAVFDSSLINKVADTLTEAAPVIQSANKELDAIQPTGNKELDTAVAELREPIGKISDLLDSYGTLAGRIENLKGLLPKA